MPETIIIDEIGTELEALASSTIAQRGVQLVGTAHGMTIENIIKNPSLQLLVGGIEVWAKPLLPILSLNVILGVNLCVLLVDQPALFFFGFYSRPLQCLKLETLLGMLNIICKLRASRFYHMLRSNLLHIC